MNGTTKRRVGFGALTGLVIAGVIGVNSLNVSGQVAGRATRTPYAPVRHAHDQRRPNRAGQS